MVFPFFRLPREIRDAVYEYTITAHKEVTIPQTDDDTKTYTFDAPLPALLRCNRALSIEYKELLPEKRRMLVLGADSDNWLGYPDISEHLARTIDECTVVIHNGCLCDNMEPEERADRDLSSWQCDGEDFFETYTEALPGFLGQFPRLHEVRLRVGLHGSDEVKHDTQDLCGDEPQLRHTVRFPTTLGELLMTSSKITDLELFRCRSTEAYRAYCYEYLHGLSRSKTAQRSNEIYTTWKTGQGWRAGPAIKECSA